MNGGSILLQQFGLCVIISTYMCVCVCVYAYTVLFYGGMQHYHVLEYFWNTKISVSKTGGITKVALRMAFLFQLNLYFVKKLKKDCPSADHTPSTGTFHNTKA
jgi:hypothetical protein